MMRLLRPAVVLFALTCALVVGIPRDAGAGGWRETGRFVPALRSFDEVMRGYMQERGISRAALAVTRRGRLVLARGYNWEPTVDSTTAEFELSLPAGPNSLFRIASISKPLTAVSVLRLVESGELQLSQKVDTILGHAGWQDERWRKVTIGHLLAHRGGWDRFESFDPMFADFRIQQAQGRPLPTNPQRLIDFMKGHRLEFDPGERYAYSNFGYCLLGRVIEKVSGCRYEAYVQDVLRAAGINHMKLARSAVNLREPGEVEYCDPPRGQVASVLGATGPQLVPRPYGGFNIESMDAHGGWLGSAEDLARFVAAFDDLGHSPLLKEVTIRKMWSRPEGAPGPVYYGLGWQVRELSDGRINVWHTGSLPGTYAILVRRYDGLNWVALFNTRAADAASIDERLHQAADAVDSWPSHDLFAR